MQINTFPKCFNSVCATFCIYFTQLSILHKCFVIYNVQLKINLPLLLIWLRKTKIQYSFYKSPLYANAINKWGKFISFLIRSNDYLSDSLANSFIALVYYYYCVNYCLKHTVYNATLHVSEAAPTGSGSVVSLCEYLSCILRSDQSHRTELSQL